MKAKHVVAAALVGASILTGVVSDPPVASAQNSTTGAVQGTVKEESTGEALIGVTIIASSASMQGTQTAITDENGFYRITNLPPGEYIITFYYAELEVRRSGITVGVNKTSPVFQKLNTTGAGEKIEIVDSAPTIDPTSTSQGITLDQEYTRNIPVPGRTFEAALGAAAGSQSDGLGVAFSGSTSLENQYYVDGVNTTGLNYGTVGSPVINDFIEEIEVLTGGYNAEFGRATGGIVNVVTKSGTNEFKGSVFGYFTPGALVAERQIAPSQTSSIDAESNLAYSGDFGVELGGPILKDKVWFYVGLSPAFSKTDTRRRVKRRTDCRVVLADGTLSPECRPWPLGNTSQDPTGMGREGYADSQPDRDPDTGFFLFDEVDIDGNPANGVQNEIYPRSGRALSALGKINFAVTPEHQGQLSVTALPQDGKSVGVNGVPAFNQFEYSALTTNAGAKWTSKFNDNKTEVEGVLGWFRSTYRDGNRDESRNALPGQVLYLGNLGTWSSFGGETPETQRMCTDNTIADPNDPNRDPYQNIANCPEEFDFGYSIGGPGSLSNEKEDRRSAKVGITQRLKAAGSHEIKAGIDAELNTLRKDRLLSGGAFINNILGGYVWTIRWAQLSGEGVDPMTTRFNNECRRWLTDPNDPTMTLVERFQCDYLSGEKNAPGTVVTGRTTSVAAYLRDSWQIQPNLTVNVGLRYEEQALKYADGLANTTDALTGRELGEDAMVLKGMFAPRLGILYDWTKEGRSKIYAHWGRFYESIPMQINDRSFGGEVRFDQYWSPSATQCGPTDDNIGGPNGQNCLLDNPITGQDDPNDNMDPNASLFETMYGASGVLVAPGIKAQYMDEVLGGVEYELIDDLKIGLSFQNRKMGRVIEDVSSDGADTYVIANPGEWSEEEETKLMEEIGRQTDCDDGTGEPVMGGNCERLLGELEHFRGIRLFDKPRRDYNAITATVTRRFSKSLYMQGSYTYSRTQGNYPGLFSPDNGQVDPNISSQYDLIELLANRDGPLPTDRPHYIKVDGYYIFDLKKAGELTVGTRFRALSGVPKDALAPHFLYGPDESFILPRGVIGRNDFEHSIDMHLGYGRELGGGMTLELFTDLYNVYNRQGTFLTDETYVPNRPDNNANPISGGSYEDLIWAKAVTDQGVETNTPVVRNENFGNTVIRYAPFSARFGLRLTF